MIAHLDKDMIKVLSPPPEKRPVVLHPAVEKPFRQTMRQMGYGGEF